MRDQPSKYIYYFFGVIAGSATTFVLMIYVFKFHQ